MDHVTSSVTWQFDSPWALSYRLPIGNNLLSPPVSETFSLKYAYIAIHIQISTWTDNKECLKLSARILTHAVGLYGRPVSQPATAQTDNLGDISCQYHVTSLLHDLVSSPHRNILLHPRSIRQINRRPAVRSVVQRRYFNQAPVGSQPTSLTCHIPATFLRI